MEPIEGAMFGMMFIPEYVFFSSLVCYELLKREINAKLKNQALGKLKTNLKRLEVWAKEAPSNYSHKLKIVLALHLILNSKFQDAISELKKAIVEAKNYGYQLEEALANEMIASIWDKLGEEQYRNIHLVEAHYRYASMVWCLNLDCWNLLIFPLKSMQEGILDPSLHTGLLL